MDFHGYLAIVFLTSVTATSGFQVEANRTSYVVYLGETVVIECLLKDKDLVLFTMISRDGVEKSLLTGIIPVPPRVEKHERYSMRSSGSEPVRYYLTIKNCSRADSGRLVFVTYVNNTENRVNVHLLVKAPPLSPELSVPTTLQEGHVVNVSCHVNGAEPKAEVALTIGGEPVDDLKLESDEQMYGSTVVSGKVRLLREHNDIQIGCVARSPESMWRDEPSVKQTRLNVHYAPVVRVSPDQQLAVMRGENYNISCSCDSNPTHSPLRWYRNTTILNVRGGLLSLVGVERSLSGSLYSCVCSNSLGQRNSSTHLTVLRKPVARVVPVSSFNELQEAEVTCSAEGEPEPEVRWVKNSDLIVNSDTLYFSSIRRENSGNYSCVASAALYPTNRAPVLAEHVAPHTLHVRYKPGPATIHSQPYVRNGSNITLRCKCRDLGYPPGDYLWTHGGQQLASGRDYRLRKVSFGAEGTYTCHVQNELGAGTEDSQLLIVYQPPEITDYPVSRIEQLETVSEPMSMTCNVTSKPAAVITWFKLRDGRERLIQADSTWYTISERHSSAGQGVVQGAERRLNITSSTLVFQGENRRNLTRLVPEDSAVYSCKAQIPALVGVRQRSSTLNVKYSPSLSSNTTSVYISQDDVTVVSCTAQGYPLPTITWYDHNQQPLVKSDHVKIITVNESRREKVTSQLHLSRPEVGELVCTAGNDVIPDTQLLIRLLPAEHNPALQKEDEGLSDSQLIAIIVGVSASFVLLVIAVLLFVTCRRRRGAKHQRRPREKPRGRATPIALTGETSDSSGELLQSPKPHVARQAPAGHQASAGYQGPAARHLGLVRADPGHTRPLESDVSFCSNGPSMITFGRASPYNKTSNPSTFNSVPYTAEKSPYASNMSPYSLDKSPYSPSKSPYSPTKSAYSPTRTEATPPPSANDRQTPVLSTFSTPSSLVGAVPLSVRSSQTSLKPLERQTRTADTQTAADTQPDTQTDTQTNTRPRDTSTAESEESGYTTDTPPKRKVIYEVVV